MQFLSPRQQAAHKDAQAAAQYAQSQRASLREFIRNDTHYSVSWDHNRDAVYRSYCLLAHSFVLGHVH